MYVDANGTKYWSLNDKFHREDGPAVEYVDGTKRWFFKDEEVTWKEVFRNANGIHFQNQLFFSINPKGRQHHISLIVGGYDSNDFCHLAI